MRVIVVGGGVLGAMHALWAHDAGHQVVQLEREAAARGASLRNFGLIWVGGRAPGAELRLAQLARDLWTGVAERIPGVGLRAEGSLTVARTEDELLVLKEAAAQGDAPDRGYRLLDPAGVRALNPALRGGLTGGLYCSRDAIVEPRLVPAAIREHLRRSPRYRWTPGTEAVEVRPGGVRDGHGEWHSADLVICCTGAAHRGIAAHAGPRPLRRVRLQMLQTAPLAERLTTSVAEPLSALDAKVRLQLRDLIRSVQLRLGTTTLFVTHDQEEALSMADRVGVMREGRLEQIAAPDELYAHPATAFVAEFVGTMNHLPAVLTPDGAQVLGRAVQVRDRADRSMGDGVTALVRPEGLGLTPAAAGPGIVAGKTFLGSVTRVMVLLSEETSVRIDVPSVSAGALSLGDPVEVALTADSVLITDRA
jgi:glycine/D-amino acid oxidase-like deaminating enzyme